jgi:hypothetical protein
VTLLGQQVDPASKADPPSGEAALGNNFFKKTKGKKRAFKGIPALFWESEKRTTVHSCALDL